MHPQILPRRQKCQPLETRLRDEKAVEGIAVMMRQFTGVKSVRRRDRQLLHAVRCETIRDVQGRRLR